MKTLARERDKAELLHRLQRLRPDRVARWGRMSAHQMVCHLTDAFRMMTGDKLVSDSTSRLQRTIVKWIALYLPLSWPAGIPTRPEIDQELGGTRPAAFADDLDRLAALVAQVTPAGRRDHRPHPIFGRMSEGAWLRWGYLHVDHHLRQFGL